MPRDLYEALTNELGDLEHFQEQIDDLVCDLLERGNTGALNEAHDPADQEALIEDIEALASRINNSGPAGQIHWISQHMTIEEIKAAISPAPASAP